MSDFGTIIIFRKKSGDFSQNDIELIENELKTIVTTEVFPSNICNGNFSELRNWEEVSYCSLITEYYDDEDAEEIREFAIEEDLPECERIIELLMPILGADFEMVAKFEEW